MYDKEIKHIYSIKKIESINDNLIKLHTKTFLPKLIYNIRTPAEVHYDYALVGLNP